MSGDGEDRLDDADALGYAEAAEELDRILAVLEQDDLDIDVLGPQVQRAAQLIRVCRDRIGAARHDVERIVADLDELGASPSEPRDPTGT
jgi:exodeoxyribonuclease VII small subunit